MLRLAAREADIVGLIPQFSAKGRPTLSDVTEAAMERKAAIVRKAAGDRFERLILDLFIADAGLIGSGPLQWTLAAIAKAGAVALAQSPYFLFGTVEGLRKRLERRRTRTGISAYSIPLQRMEAMAPLVDALRGQ
jgi:hypothetical protein